MEEHVERLVKYCYRADYANQVLLFAGHHRDDLRDEYETASAKAILPEMGLQTRTEQGFQQYLERLEPLCAETPDSTEPADCIFITLINTVVACAYHDYLANISSMSHDAVATIRQQALKTYASRMWEQCGSMTGGNLCGQAGRPPAWMQSKDRASRRAVQERAWDMMHRQVKMPQHPGVIYSVEEEFVSTSGNFVYELRPAEGEDGAARVYVTTEELVQGEVVDEDEDKDEDE